MGQFCWTHRPSESAQAEGALLLYLLRLQRLQVQGLRLRPTDLPHHAHPARPPHTPAPSLTATSQPSERGNFLSFGNTFHWLFSFPKGDPSDCAGSLGRALISVAFPLSAPRAGVNFSLSHTWTPVQSHPQSRPQTVTHTPLPP